MIAKIETQAQILTATIQMNFTINKEKIKSISYPTKTLSQYIKIEFDQIKLNQGKISISM